MIHKNEAEKKIGGAILDKVARKCPVEKATLELRPIADGECKPALQVQVGVRELQCPRVHLAQRA